MVKVLINLSGEVHSFKCAGNNPLNTARRALMKKCGISYARTRGLHYELKGDMPCNKEKPCEN